MRKEKMECVMGSDLHIARACDRWIDRDQEKRNAKYESSWSKTIQQRNIKAKPKSKARHQQHTKPTASPPSFVLIAHVQGKT